MTYFGIPTLEECKEIALQAKIVRDDKLFLRFLSKFEKLGYYVLHRVRRGCPWIAAQEMDDLRHTTIVGILRAFNSVPETEPPRYLPLRVIAYVRTELNSAFRHCREDYLVNYAKIQEACPPFSNPQISFKAHLDLLPISKQEKALLHKKLFLGKTYQEIVEEGKHKKKRGLTRVFNDFNDLLEKLEALTKTSTPNEKKI